MIHLSTRDIHYRTDQAAGLIDLIVEFYGNGKDANEWIADVLLAVVDKENNAELLMEAHFGKRSNHRKSIAMDVIRSF